MWAIVHGTSFTENLCVRLSFDTLVFAPQAMFGQVQAAFESGLQGALGSSSAAHTAGAAALSEAVARVSKLADM